METLYRKVAVSERLPEKGNPIFIKRVGNEYLSHWFGKYNCDETIKRYSHWLEEIPDPTSQRQADKAEIIEMLEEMYSKYEKDGHLLNVSPSKIKSLIQKHKQ